MEFRSRATPRPVPQFYDVDRPTFSTKKERSSPNHYHPNRPAAKSAPPISRIFPHRLLSQKAQPISFKSHSENSLSMSRHYNESNRALYFDQCFTIEAKLGEGSFGEVFKVRSKEDGLLYAIKRGREKFRNASDRLAKLGEVQKHETLPKHTNVVEFIQAWEEGGCLYIQTELCQTSLSDFAEQNHDIPESTVWNFFVDLLLAVKHLHDHQLIHLDIKPDNIFISRNGICKLGDFGLVYDLNRVGLTDAQEGDAKYLAPEILKEVIGKSNDVFSLGVTLMELACDLDLPSHGESWQLIRQGRLPDELLQRLSPELQRIIRLMLHPDHKVRPSIDQLLRLPVVRRVLRRRRYAFYYSHVVDAIRGLLAVAWLYMCFFFAASVAAPLRRLKLRSYDDSGSLGRKKLYQPQHQQSRFVDPVVKPLNFDNCDGFSDDDSNEISSIHNCSIQNNSPGILGRQEASGSDSSGRSTTDVNSFASPLRSDIPTRKLPPWNSTPAQRPLQRRTVLFESPNTRSSTPSDPTHNASSERSRLNMSLVDGNLSLPASFHSAMQNSTRSVQLSLSTSEQRPIMPKNLLDAFEGTSSDEAEDS